MTVRLTLISHAPTAAVRRSAFPTDEPLDPRGEAEATAAACHLRQPDRCWTSPELRTRQTASALNLAAVAEPRLRDCDYGTWAGRSLEEVSGQDAEAAAAWLRDPLSTVHGGESLLSVMRRVAAWLDGLAVERGRIIVVTHPAIIRAAIVHALDATPKSFWRIDIAPLSRACLSGDRNRWNLKSIGPLETSDA